MNEQELRDAVLAVLTDVAPDVDAEAIDPKVAFRDQFDFDSMDFMNFAIGLSERFAIAIPETDYPELSSLSGSIDYLQRQIAVSAG